MTRNQISLMEHRETMRANRAQEAISREGNRLKHEANKKTGEATLGRVAGDAMKTVAPLLKLLI